MDEDTELAYASAIIKKRIKQCELNESSFGKTQV